MHNNAFYRALRCDKLTFTILENVLRTYSSSKDISTENLAVHLLNRDRGDLKKMGKSILENIKKSHIEKYQIALVESTVEAGSGSLPTKKLPSYALHFSTNEISASKISHLLEVHLSLLLDIFIKKNLELI